MKKELIKTFLEEIPIDELEVSLKNQGLILKGQKIASIKGLTKDRLGIAIILSEKVIVEVPDNLPDSFLNSKLEDLDINIRTYNILRSIGVQNIAGIIAHAVDLRKFRGIGTKNYEGLIRAIAGLQKRLGIEFKTEDLFV